MKLAIQPTRLTHLSHLLQDREFVEPDLVEAQLGQQVNAESIAQPLSLSKKLLSAAKGTKSSTRGCLHSCCRFRGRRQRLSSDAGHQQQFVGDEAPQNELPPPARQSKSDASLELADIELGGRKPKAATGGGHMLRHRPAPAGPALAHSQTTAADAAAAAAAARDAEPSTSRGV